MAELNNPFIKFSGLPDNLKNDMDFILEIVSENYKILAYVSEELRDNKEFMLRAIQRSILAECYASKRLQNDKDFILEKRRIYDRNGESSD